MKTLLSFLLVALAVSSASAGRRLDILFLGDNGHHKPAERYPQLLSALGPRGINLHYTDDMADLNLDVLRRYDGLAIYANTTEISPEQEKALLTYVYEGGGFIPLHCASYCFLNSAQYVKLVGGQFKSHGGEVFRTQITMPDHPIMKGFVGFETWDETYVHHRHGNDRTILQKREDEPWTWVRTSGKGRVFYTAYGHDARCWGNPGFHDLVYRGIKWAVGDKAASDLESLGLPELVRMDGYKVPNYERRPEPIKPHKPLSPEDSLKLTQIPADCEISLVASEKDGLYNVIEMDWDERGRMWVIETRDYPNELKPSEQGKDRIRILEDSNGDGKMDKATLFADQLSIPTSMTFANDGVIVSMAPHFLFLKDTDGDDKADERKILITGWSTGDTHAGPSNLQYGFDNWIYGCMGYAGFNGTVGGEQHRFGQGVYRFKPDGSKLEYMGRTSNNTWGLAFSENGDIFGSTANNQSSFYLPIPKRFYDAVDGLEAQTLPGIDANKKFFPNTPNIRQVDVMGGFTAAAGHYLYTARSFPQDWWNRAAMVNAPTGNLLYRANVDPEGTHFVASNGWNIVASADEWFSPVFADVGPDGAIWFSDWYSFMIQHNPTPSEGRGGFNARRGRGNAFVTDLRDTEHTRIYRIAHKDGVPSQAHKLSKNKPGDLLIGLTSDNLLWRRHAQRLLVERGDTDVAGHLHALIGTPPDAVGIAAPAIHALWTLHGLDAVGAKAVAAGLDSKSEGVRRAAVLVAPKSDTMIPLLVDALKDEAPLVRLSTLLALAEQNSSEVAGKALYAARNDTAFKNDRWLPTAFQMAAVRHGAGYLTAAVADSRPATPEKPKPVEQPKAENLVANAGFEAVGENNLPKQWAVRTYQGRANHKAVQPGRGGKGYCLQIDSDGGSDSSMHFDLPVKPRSNYELSAWVKTEGIKGNCHGAGLNIHALPGQPRTKFLKGTNDWTRVKVNFKTGGANSIGINCLYGGWGRATGKAWWDDIELVQTGESSGPDPADGIEALIAANLPKNATPLQINTLVTAIVSKPTELGELIRKNLASGHVEVKAAAENIDELRKTHHVVELKSVEGLKFDKEQLKVPAGKPVALVFSNPDLLQHNLVIGKPGSYDTIGAAADKIITAPDAIEKQYIPDIPEILHATKLLDPGATHILKFTLPKGEYPYVCTFPGHWRIMRGVIVAE